MLRFQPELLCRALVGLKRRRTSLLPLLCGTGGYGRVYRFGPLAHATSYACFYRRNSSAPDLYRSFQNALLVLTLRLLSQPP